MDDGVVNVQDLDLRVQFQPSDTVLCEVDFSLRQCNGVRMTADALVDKDSFKTIQAVKFDEIGDFNYMVYT